MRHWCRHAAVALALVVYSAPASAGDDYESASTAWNGLGTLAGLARGQGLEVLQVSRIDWNELGKDDVVFMLYPTDHVEPNSLAAFIRNGGRVLFADDFGRGSDAIERLSMLRRHGVGVDAKHYDNLEYAPIAKPVAPRHPLAEGVDELTCNHPAVLTSVKGPEIIFGFSNEESVVVAGALGSGRFVVLSDPSVLINRMLEFEGNLQFAINLLRFLARGPEGRLVLLVDEFALSGHPKSKLDESESKLAGGISDLNRWLEELNDYFLTEPSLRIIGLIIAIGLGLLAATSLPLRNRIALEGGWTKARPDAPPPDSFQSLVNKYDSKKTANWVLPATVLRDNLVRRLRQLTGLKHPLEKETALYAAMAESCGKSSVSAIRPYYGQLRDLPTRAQAQSAWHPPHLSKRDFERLNAGVQALYRTLPSENS